MTKLGESFFGSDAVVFSALRWRSLVAVAMLSACRGNEATPGTGSGVDSLSDASESGLDVGASGQSDTGSGSEAGALPNPVGCPSSTPDSAPASEAACPTGGAICAYPGTRCWCRTGCAFTAAGFGPRSSFWFCEEVPSSCPVTEPDAGTPCNSSASDWCDYGACAGARGPVACMNGTWQLQGMSCPAVEECPADGGPDADRSALSDASPDGSDIDATR
jgi:hypothetical protein